MAVESAKFGPEFQDAGYLAAKGSTDWGHRFGGASWRCVDDDPLCGGPTLLMVLDLGDPLLGPIGSSHGLGELPLCSYVNALVWAGRQRYKLNGEAKTVRLVERESTLRDCLEPEDRLPNPLEEVSVSLVEMRPGDLPTDEQRYWEACGEFAGGRSFIRVLGSPLWLEHPHSEWCRCGREMQYVAAVGSESFDEPSGILQGEAFFIGEGALYFFWCAGCSEIAVVSQAT
jgi:hypothetical protein